MTGAGTGVNVPAHRRWHGLDGFTRLSTGANSNSPVVHMSGRPGASRGHPWHRHVRRRTERRGRRFMTTRLRWVAGMLLAAVLGALTVAATSAHASSTPPPPATTLNGIAFGYLPSGLGTSTDFDYAFSGVHFAARVWESQSGDGGWRVDLDVDVMRGRRLTDGKALHDWFIAYEDRPPAQARYIAVGVHGHPGWLSRGQVFWLQRPGLAVSVSLDRTRWPVPDVVQTGWSAYETAS